MRTDQTISVSCRSQADGWACEVKVGEDAAATEHQVTLDRDLLQRLRPGATDPEQLVRDSFAFLLEREPRESILRSFELPVIERYFPDWESVIRSPAAGA